MKLYTYRLPVHSLPRSRGGGNDREGLLVYCPDRQRWAEAAPLPGLSCEDLTQVLQSARAGRYHDYPSLQFAIDSLDLPAPSVDHVLVNGLLAGSLAEVLTQADCLRQQGFRAVKLKVGDTASVAEQVQQIRRVRVQLGPDVLLRLDANRAWDLKTAVAVGRQIADLQLAYCEEPTRSPADFEAFFAATGIPYALDETLRAGPARSDFPHAAALVIKPTLQGGLAAIRTLAAWQKPLVFSSCFESGVGLWNIARLAAQWAPQIPAGLDTYRWLRSDVLTERLQMQNGTLRLPPQIQVDQASLQEVTA